MSHCFYFLSSLPCRHSSILSICEARFKEECTSGTLSPPIGVTNRRTYSSECPGPSGCPLGDRGPTCPSSQPGKFYSTWILLLPHQSHLIQHSHLSIYFALVLKIGPRENRPAHTVHTRTHQKSHANKWFGSTPGLVLSRL